MRSFRMASALVVLLAAARVLAQPPPPGAWSCSGCHLASPGAAGAPASLAGRKAADIAGAVADFRTGRRPATVMDRIAKGFSDDEIAAIAAWWQDQRP